MRMDLDAAETGQEKPNLEEKSRGERMPRAAGVL
jgi:hypothetical protein